MVLDGDRGAFFGIGAAVDALGEVVAVGHVAPVRGLRLAAVEAELDGIEEGRLAASVHAAEEDDRLAGLRGEDGFLPAGVGAEVVENDAVEDHG